MEGMAFQALQGLATGLQSSPPYRPNGSSFLPGSGTLDDIFSQLSAEEQAAHILMMMRAGSPVRRHVVVKRAGRHALSPPSGGRGAAPAPAPPKVAIVDEWVSEQDGCERPAKHAKFVSEVSPRAASVGVTRKRELSPTLEEDESSQGSPARRRYCKHVEKVCDNCGTHSAPCWRWFGQLYLCNACQQYAHRHEGEMKPLGALSPAAAKALAEVASSGEGPKAAEAPASPMERDAIQAHYAPGSNTVADEAVSSPSPNLDMQLPKRYRCHSGGTSVQRTLFKTES